MALARSPERLRPSATRVTGATTSVRPMSSALPWTSGLGSRDPIATFSASRSADRAALAEYGRAMAPTQPTAPAPAATSSRSDSTCWRSAGSVSGNACTIASTTDFLTLSSSSTAEKAQTSSSIVAGNDSTRKKAICAALRAPLPPNIDAAARRKTSQTGESKRPTISLLEAHPSPSPAQARIECPGAAPAGHAGTVAAAPGCQRGADLLTYQRHSTRRCRGTDARGGSGAPFSSRLHQPPRRR